MILGYYRRSISGIATIDVLTGVTFLFSTVEMVDNLPMFMKEWFSKKPFEHMNTMSKRFDSKKEERVFMDMVSKLSDIVMGLHPKSEFSYSPPDRRSL